MKKDLFVEITNILLNLGLQPNLAGFEFLRDAIELYILKSSSDDKLTSEIYPKVAEKHNTNVMIVERGIRMLISDSFKNKGLLGLNEYLGSVVYDCDSYTLSNGEVISIVAEIVKLSGIRDRMIVKA